MLETKRRAAQYLRMSTEHQRYSLSAQADAIAKYAAKHGYEINRTYFDPGESGLTFENRTGLQALLAAALERPRAFEAILVLDISRWGRFQDIDQAAHYEYLCRDAGARVVYCAEPFADDASPVSSLLKALKRIMAAEFSRELSDKVQRARLQQAKLGYFQGGVAVYGVRRVAVDAAGEFRTELSPGARKAFASDRVVLEPGPPHALAAVRYIFRRYGRDGRGPQTIARELNAKNPRSMSGGRWRSSNVCSVLRNELAIGLYVTNKTSQTLRAGRRPRPQSEWVRTRIFPPIVRPSLFRAAQRRLGRGEREKLAPAQMLKALRNLLRQEGRLNARLLNSCSETPCAQTYRRYFGSLNTAYALIGYVPRRPKGRLPAARRDDMLTLLRRAHARHGYLTAKLVDADPALPLVQTYQKHFGSLSRAYALAGLPSDQSELIRAARRRSAQQRAKAGLSGPLGAPSAYSNDDLLAALRATFRRHQFVSAALLDSAVGTSPGASLYRIRFGSLSRAYVLAGIPEAFLNRYRLRRFADRIIAAKP